MKKRRANLRAALFSCGCLIVVLVFWGVVFKVLGMFVHWIIS